MFAASFFFPTSEGYYEQLSATIPAGRCPPQWCKRVCVCVLNPWLLGRHIYHKTIEFSHEENLATERELKRGPHPVQIDRIFMGPHQQEKVDWLVFHGIWWWLALARSITPMSLRLRRGYIELIHGGYQLWIGGHDPVPWLASCRKLYK